jgi:hypothetical protein
MPAEALIKELFTGLKDDQKKAVAKAYDTSKAGALVRRVVNPNRALDQQIGKVYTKAQIELLEKIVKSLSNGDDGYRRISRGGTWDASGKFENCGADFFGDPTSGKWAFLFTGHHLTMRCDGNSEEGAAFGGPFYYGHTPHGYSSGNIFFYQTKSAMNLFKALDEKQREKATVLTPKNPGEGAPSVQFKKRAEDRPGLIFNDLTKDQKALVEQVMRDVLSPYRKEDVDAVMEVVKKNGGVERLQLAVYPENIKDPKEPWTFWRLEGPGFVWNYRVLPHVHTYVNITSKVT